jgi:enoyl-CoA hydratase/carnithine racemase
VIRSSSGPQSSTVQYALDGDGVLTLTLNRPERNNAWNREMEETLHGLLEDASESEDVRVIVLTGAGRAFCPGLDTEDLDRVSRPGQSYDQTGRRPMVLPALVPKPIVCAINGACAGLGLITALMSDVRFASEDARLTTAFARRGLPAEEAVSWILPRIVGHAIATDLLLSSRVVLGSEAVSLGLVHRAVPGAQLLSAAHAYARDIALHCSPIAVATAKRQIYGDWHRTLAESRSESRRLLGVLEAASGEFREGVQSFMEKRQALFSGFGEEIDYADYPDYTERYTP